MDKIYFAGSVRGGRDDADFYFGIIDYLGRYGKVLTTHIGNKNLSALGEVGLTDVQIYNRDMAWLNESDIVIAEVTRPSLGVGYELGTVAERNSHVPEERRKKILCLYRPQDGKKPSVMLAGSDELEVAEYSTLDEAKRAIDAFFVSIEKEGHQNKGHGSK